MNKKIIKNRRLEEEEASSSSSVEDVTSSDSSSNEDNNKESNEPDYNDEEKSDKASEEKQEHETDEITINRVFFSLLLNKYLLLLWAMSISVKLKRSQKTLFIKLHYAITNCEISKTFSIVRLPHDTV